MKLLFLHGGPATGKLTIAREIAALTGAPLSDNHATIDLARTLFDFGDPGFWDLVNTLRQTMLEAAAASPLDLLITTACYDHPGDLGQLEALEAILRRSESGLLPVHLVCDQMELERRVTNPDRVERRKICSVDGLRGYQAGNCFDPVPRDGVFTLDTTLVPAAETARQIVERLGLEQAE